MLNGTSWTKAILLEDAGSECFIQVLEITESWEKNEIGVEK